MRSFGSLRAHRVVLVILVCFLAAILLVLALPYRYNVQDALSYSTRPLWDTPETPRSSITHLQAAGVPANDSNSCSRHGWSPRQPGVALWDATLISTELDMLEIRLRELWDTVDLFLVMESTHTMTGIRKKRMFYEENQARFLPWRAKIRYKVFHGREARKGDGLFTLANEQRRAMGAFIDEQGPPPGTLVIMADVDEIPSHATAELIKACDSPLPLHLQLQNYLYSFEFATMADSWRAQVHSWDDAKGRDGYSHGRSTDHILTASGWHCSFCFATLADVRYKMLSASHIDRLLKRPNYQSYLADASIQSRMCTGKDLYDMPPEAFSWMDVVRYWNGAHRKQANVNLPLAVVQDWKRFQYLLPGHCQRQKGTTDDNITLDHLRLTP